MLLLMLLTGVGGVKAEDFTLSSADEITQNGITVSFAKGSGSNAPAWYDAGLRFYANNTITISSENNISSVTFNWEKQGSKAFASVTASVGDYSHPTAAGEGVWSGSAKSITFTIGTSGQLQLNTFSVIVEGGTPAEKKDVTLSFGDITEQSVKVGTTIQVAATATDNVPVTYTSGDENIATVDNNGVVTGVSVGETTITASFEGDDTHNSATSVSYTIKVINENESSVSDVITNTDYQNETYGKFTIKGKPSGAEYVGYATKNGTAIQLKSADSVSGLVVKKSAGKVSCVKLVWNSGTTDGRTIDVYGKNTAYEAASDLYNNSKKGTKIGSLTYKNNKYEASLEIVDDYKFVGIRSNSGALYLMNVEFVWEKIPESIVEDPTFSVPAGTYFEAQSVELTCATDGATIYYTLDGSDPTSESTPYTDPITISETKILKAIAIKGDDASAIATAEYKIVDTTGKGTEENPFTVADARNILSEGLTLTDVYVKGIVSGIVEAYNSKFGNISYNISDDGATESDQLQAYRGKGKNGDNFTSDADIQVKDVVVLKGNLIDYNGTYELAAGNQLVSLVRPEKAEPNLTYANAAVSAVRGEAFTAPVLTNPNNLTVVYTSSDKTVATVDSESGEVTLLKAGETTITASFAGNADYKEGSASYTLTVTVLSHTATFFVNGQQQGEPATVAEDEAITFPTVADELYGKKFVGWTTAAIDGETNDKPATLVNAATMGTADVTYYAVYANVTAGTATNTVDELTLATTGVSGNNYAEWSGETATSNAVYAGQSAGGNESIQLRSKNSDSGVVSTFSGGKLKKVVVVWNDATDEGRTLNVYGKATAYEAATDLYDSENQGTLLGSIVKGTSTELTIDGDYAYIGLRSASGAMYLNSISIIWENGTPDTYSDYCTTVVAPVKPAKPIIFHDDGEYEDALTVAIAGEGTIMYTLNDGEAQTYSAPFTIKEDATIKAWAVKDGVASDVTEPKTFTIVEKAKGAVVEDGYYTIQTNDDDGKYVNVAGRKTVTLVNDTKSAGTVIRVKAEEDGVKVLRSQAVDLPRYAERAMSYVPELVKEVVKKLAANVDDPIIGEQGADLILDKFNKEFDYHLYLEGENNTYRIYGRTPSMKPVVDFYAENKELIDGRLLKVEGFVKEVLQKVVDKVGRGQSVVDMFKVKTIWQNMGGTLTEPTDDASTLKFYEEVLSSETNVWNFAYQTGMLYWEKVKGYLTENAGSLGDYGKYIEKIPQIRPNFKYYIVPSASGVDIISEGNSEIKNASTAWTLTKRESFDVTFDATLSKNNGKEMYKTLYVDFGYKLPDGVTALKVTAIDENTGVAKTEEIGQEVAPQTPVLLKSDKAGDITLNIGDNFGSAVTDNLLKGNDYLINKYEINSSTAEGVFTILGTLSQSLADKYEYLRRKNAGTVGNKYFFALSNEDLDKCVAPNEEGEKDCVVRNLSIDDNGQLGFFNNWQSAANEAFLVSQTFNPVKLTLVGDINRDGSITIADVTALVNIILGKATPEKDSDKYDFDAAYVNDDNVITIADVTALVNIILGK